MEIAVTESFAFDAVVAFAKGDQSTIFKKFKQALLIQTLLISIFYIIPSFYADNIISLIYSEEDYNLEII